MLTTDCELDLSLVDHTYLKDDMNDEAFNGFCQNAEPFQSRVASICVYPNRVKALKAQLPELTRIATVCNFPNGDETIATVIQQIDAIQANVDELDVVIPYQAYLQNNNIDEIHNFLSAIRGASYPKCLKIIIESGAFNDQSQIKELCLACIEHEVDFIKTSTGKIHTGATLEAVRTIAQCIADQDSSTGIKISGGIKSVEDTVPYLDLIFGILGEEWLCTERLRFGASQLIA